MGKVTEVELKVKVSKDEFLDFMNTNKYFIYNKMCVKEDTYFKKESVNDGSFIRLRSEKLFDVHVSDGLDFNSVIWEYLLSDDIRDVALCKTHDMYVTLKTKHVDEHGIETNEEQEGKLSCSNPDGFISAYTAANKDYKWFSKTKRAMKFIVDLDSEKLSQNLNLEFVHVKGIDGVFAEIEYVNPTGIAEEDLPKIVDWLKTIILEIGFNDEKIEPRSWKEMLGI